MIHPSYTAFVEEEVLPRRQIHPGHKRLDGNVTGGKVLVSSRLKMAVTDTLALIVTTQSPAPVQAPLQPANRECGGSAKARRVTTACAG